MGYTIQLKLAEARCHHARAMGMQLKLAAECVPRCHVQLLPTLYPPRARLHPTVVCYFAQVTADNCTLTVTASAPQGTPNCTDGQVDDLSVLLVGLRLATELPFVFLRRLCKMYKRCLC